MDNQGYNGSDPVNQVRAPSVNSEFQQQVQPLAPPTLGNVSGNPPSTASLNLNQVHQSNKGTYPPTLHNLMLRQQHQKLLDEKLRRELELCFNSARLDIMSQSLPNSAPVSAFVNPPGVSQRAKMHTGDPTLSLPSTFGQIGSINSSSAILPSVSSDDAASTVADGASTAASTSIAASNATFAASFDGVTTLTASCTTKYTSTYAERFGQPSSNPSRTNLTIQQILPLCSQWHLRCKIYQII